jgi:hypothetical protein
MDDFCFASDANHLRVVQKVLFSLYPRMRKSPRIRPEAGRVNPRAKVRVVCVNPGLKSEVAYILDAHLAFRSPGLQSGVENLQPSV